MGENSKHDVSAFTLRWPTDARTCAECEHDTLFFFQSPCRRCPGNPDNPPSRLTRAYTLIVGLRRARDSWRKRCLRAERQLAVTRDATDNFLVPIARDAVTDVAALTHECRRLQAELAKCNAVISELINYAPDPGEE